MIRRISQETTLNNHDAQISDVSIPFILLLSIAVMCSAANYNVTAAAAKWTMG
jgi:hypothetical protein